MDFSLRTIFQRGGPEYDSAATYDVRPLGNPPGLMQIWARPTDAICEAQSNRLNDLRRLMAPFSGSIHRSVCAGPLAFGADDRESNPRIQLGSCKISQSLQRPF